MKKMIDAVIEEVIIDSKKMQPIIVNFQNGQLKDEETKKMKVGLFNDGKNKKTVIALSNGQTVYKGYRPNLNKNLTYTMLAIHNKKTGKIKLIQAERWDVAPVLDEHIDNINDDEIDKSVALNKQFGSKKVKRRTEQFEKMKINVDNVKEQLEQIVTNIEIQREELDPISKDMFLNDIHLIPINRNATRESEIYDIYNIVPENILKTLYSQVNQATVKIKEKPIFFIQTVKHCKNDQEYTAKIAMLLYIEAVVSWLNNPIRSAKDIVVCPHSLEVNNYVIETYSIATANGRQRPNSTRDKGIIHCIILGLTIWNYKLDLELLSTMFKIRIGIKKLHELARWICAVPDQHDKKIVTFKIPIPSQPCKIIMKKKKNK